MANTHTDPITSLDKAEHAVLFLLPEIIAAKRREEGDLARQIGFAAPSTLGPRHLDAVFLIFYRGGLTVGELAQALHVKITTASLVARELQDAGFVERRQDEVDRRRIRLQVTADRRAMVEMILDRRTAVLRAALRTLTDDDRDGLIRALTAFAQQLGIEAPSDEELNQ